MPELDDRQLDLAIRDLVGRAAADAPTPPSIDDLSARPIRLEPDDDRDRSRWIVTGIAGMSIAAAVVGLLVLGRPDDIAEAPATEPTTLPATAPTLTPTLPPSTVPVTGPPVVVTGPESTPAPTTTPTTTPTTAPTTTVPPVAATDEVIMIAGYDGIVVDDGTSLTDVLTGTPAQTAHRVPDGRVFFQRRLLDPPGIFVYSGSDTPDAQSDTTVQEVAMPPDFGAAAVLHDVAVVNGEVVLLVESSTGGSCSDPNTCLGSIWAIWPDRGTGGEGVMIEESNVWESGWFALSLSDTGVIVGTWSSEAAYGLYSRVIPGVDAQPVVADGLGLDPDYFDCSTCPKAFTIDRTGQYIGWLDTPNDGSLAIVVHSLGAGWTFSYNVLDVSDLPPFASLEIGAIETDPTGLLAGTAIVNETDPTSATAARVYDLMNSSNEPIVIGKAGERMAFSS